jgi:amidase
MSNQVHAYSDDVLADHDGIALAALIRSGDVSRREVLEAALARAAKVDSALRAVQVLDAQRALAAASQPRPGPFSGVPTFVKDNTDVAGLPTGHGSEAFTAVPAKGDAPFCRTLVGLGLVPLGKSRLPEFGFNATTEFMTQEPVRNPWDTDVSAGASSGGSAALVAAGMRARGAQTEPRALQALTAGTAPSGQHRR